MNEDGTYNFQGLTDTISAFFGVSIKIHCYIPMAFLLKKPSRVTVGFADHIV